MSTRTPAAEVPKASAAASVTLNRAEVNKLLVKARKAMAAGQLPEAEGLLRQAESAKVKYPVLHFGDTPTKIRRDLQRLMSKQGAAKPSVATAGHPSPVGQRYAGTRTAGSQDPFQQLPSTLNGTNPVPTNKSMLPPPLAAMGQPTTQATTQPSVQTAGEATALPAVVKPLPQVSTNQQPIRLAAATEAVPVDLTLPNAFSSTPPRVQVAQAPTGKLTQLPSTGELLPAPEDAFQLLRDGENALRQGNRNEALRMFRSAHTRRNELDLQSQQQLQDHLQMLSTESVSSTPRSSGGSLLNSATASQTVVARQLSAEIGKRQSEATKLRQTDPQGALKLLEDTALLVEKSELDESMKTQLKRRIDLSVADTNRFIRDNGAEIELDRANQAVLEDIDRQREVKRQVQERLATLVHKFNALRDEQRYAEMEIVAQRAVEMAPNEPVAQQLWENAKFIRRTMLNREIAQITEDGVAKAFLENRRTAGEAVRDANTPIQYDGEYWSDIVQGRSGSSDLTNRKTASELEMKQKLRTLILPNYDNMPLADVIKSLSTLTGANIYLDPRGLGQEGVRTDTPVKLSLGQEISLESALNLILEPLHLTFMIKDEVLKVTSEQLRDGDRIQRVYNVADLVVPIPNFVPTTNMGLQGLINDAYAALPNVHQSGGGPVAYVPGQAPMDAGMPANPSIMQQQFGNGVGGGGSTPVSSGPGGLGGAAQADFDSLIDLIVSTVEHETWMENGTGQGEIQPFPTNLSLVVSQTQRVHEQIADLLKQLRRLQDLQVTIEVRFIDLRDDFFERIGVDFDFNIEDGGGADVADLNVVGSTFEPRRRSATVGVVSEAVGIDDPLPDFSIDLDVPFRNSSFGLSVPGIGNAQQVGQFGFAILSDIEAFFLLEASQGDTRSNVLQAPKVTLFNGQQAIIVDTSFTPFVISVIPVVGEFAAAQQPVIVVLSEGTMMTVQAVVSDDRRYVRLTLVPFFSQIGNVDTFTFEGSETTTASSNTTDQDDDGNNENNDNANTTVRSGTTVQLPTFQVISVATTVSVPDGGTVLLGGIKRLSEGRNEFGVPLLSKVPYLDRLFRNVGIGRTSQSLMMMVTPHIIIQEEEEDRLGISPE